MTTPSTCRACAAALLPGAAYCVVCGHAIDRRPDPALEVASVPGGPDLDAGRGHRPTSEGAFVYIASHADRGASGTTAASELLRLLFLGPLQQLRGASRLQHVAFACFAVAPFVILRATDADGSIERAAWGFAVYFGAAWLLAVHALVRPERLPLPLLGGVAGFTVVVGAALAVAVEEVLDAGRGDGFVDMVLRVGLPEELSKLLPVALFLLLGGVRHSPRAFLFVGALSGITFGVTEAVLYTTLYDDLADYLGTSTTVTTVWRLVCGGLIHGCLTGTAAFFLGLAAWHRHLRPVLLGVGIGLPALMHGAYNASSSSALGVCFAALIALVFLLYVVRGDDIALSLTDHSTEGHR